jgi:hypothetical protein
VLRWSPTADATSYHVQVGLDSTFTQSLFIDDASVQGTTREVANLAPGTLYYWRVAPKSDETASAWSTVCSFSTSPPAGLEERTVPPSIGRPELTLRPP